MPINMNPMQLIQMIKGGQNELLADLLSTYGQEIIDITNKIFSKIKNNRG